MGKSHVLDISHAVCTDTTMLESVSEYAVRAYTTADSAVSQNCTWHMSKLLPSRQHGDWCIQDANLLNRLLLPCT